MGKTLGKINPVIAALDTPKSPKPPAPPPPPPAPPAPPEPGTAPKAPGEQSPEAQDAAVQARAEAEERRRKSTFLTGPGGIAKEKFGNPQDIRKASLFGGGSRGY